MENDDDKIVLGDFDAGQDEPETLVERNLEAFRLSFPDLARALETHRPMSRLVETENGEPNVVFEQVSMYPSGAVTHADEQVRQMDLHSTRLMLGGINDDGLDFHARELCVKLRKKFETSGFSFSEDAARDESFFLIVFGVGLGLHLDALVEKTDCRTLILVESNLDFIYHSIRVYDWTQLIEKMDSRGSVRLFVDSNPDLLAKTVHAMFRAYNPTGLDGTRIYRHYQNSIFMEIERELGATLRTAVMGLGFFQDEVNMIGQTYKNLESGKARMVHYLSDAPGLPVFIIGTGPSLDGLLDFIEENQHRAILFACGTSIDVLMGRGIKPDFWIMMERSYDVYGQARETHELYDTSDIRFGGSTTIFPGVPDFFKEALFFFRPGLSPAPLFNTRHDQIVSMPDPLAANAGMSMALHLGFRELYFMGVDVGSQYQSHGHAKGSWYERHDAENIKNLSIPLPGNFGGTVWTTPELQWSKESLERLAKVNRGRRFYNLGKGALIKGVTPLHQRAAKIPDPQKSKTELLEALVESCSVYTEDEFVEAWDKAAIIDRLQDFGDQLKRIMRESDGKSEFEYIRATSDLLKPTKTDSPLPMVLRGTLFTTIIYFERFANRATDANERKVMSEIFQEYYCDLVDSLCARASEVFMSLEEGEEWVEFVS